MKKIIFVISTMLVTGILQAQDPQFSQYYASPLYLNPGFTGAMPAPRLIMNSRIQWAQLPKAFTTYALSGDVYVDRFSSGFGFMAMTDRAGSANLRTTTFNAYYSTKIFLTSKWVLSPGLMFGYGSRSIDFDKLVLGDQILYNGPTTDDAIRTLGNRSYFDFASGVVLYSKSVWAGVSAFHLNRPNHSMLGEESRVPMRMSFHGGVKIRIKHGPLSESRLASISPSFVYSIQGEFRHLDVGTSMVFDPIMVGLWYRGVPFASNYHDKAGHDAAVFILGLNLKYFEAAYSYDFTISDIGPNSGGSHELSIIMVLRGLKRNKVERKDKFLPCPTDTGFQWRE